MNEALYGFDGIAYSIGDRVEINPGTDLWMKGARYGTVTGANSTLRDRVHVKMDAYPKRVFSGSADTFKRV